MKKIILIAIFSVCLLFVCLENVLSKSRFEKVPFWTEEFNDGARPNKAFWEIEWKAYKNEGQAYLPFESNSFNKDGMLHIRCLKQEAHGKKCTSARINTKGRVSFLYGKIDVRAKMPIGKGVHPSIWMLPEEPTRPSGEIDFMESMYCWGDDKIQVNVHVYDKEDKNHQYQKMVDLRPDEWHIYSLEWYKDKLVFLVDGKTVHQVSKNDLVAWPYDRSHFLLLNVAFGGWGGSCGVDYDILPKEMLVDYVRYYKLKE